MHAYVVNINMKEENCLQFANYKLLGLVKSYESLELQKRVQFSNCQILHVIPEFIVKLGIIFKIYSSYK